MSMPIATVHDAAAALDLVCGVAATALIVVLIRRRPGLRRSRPLLASAIAVCAATDAAALWAAGHPGETIGDVLRAVLSIALLCVTAVLVGATPHMRVARSRTAAAGGAARNGESIACAAIPASALEALGDVLWIRSGQENLAYVSRAWRGRCAAADGRTIAAWRDAIHPEDRATFDAHEAATREAPDRPQQLDLRLRAPDGDYHAFAMRSTVLPGLPGEPARRLYTFAAPAAAASAAEGTATVNGVDAHALIDALPHLAWLVDSRLETHFVNAAWRRYTGLPFSPGMPSQTRQLIHPDDLPVLETAQGALRAAQPAQFEVRLRGHDGAYRWHVVHTSELSSADSRERRWIATATDIDARKSVEVALSQSAEALALRVHHDPLTNLPNRTKLLERLSQMLADGRRDGVSLALLYVDIDHFKTVNDTLGHAAGDSLLLEVAARIVGSLRNGDIASRFGGDEFIVVCNADDIADAAAIADRVQRSLRVPMELAGKRVVVGSSIGISVFPNDGTTPSDLIAKADAAMYRAKQSGRDAWCFYSAPKDGPASDTLELEAELREAIAQDQFVVYYQPIINIDSGRVIGAEALVRWSHPTRGLLLPGDFIPIAEACGMIAPIGERVLRAACVTLGAMQLRSGDDFSLAVNISAQHFARPSFVGTIARTIEEHGIEPRRLEIEITESVVMADTETVVATLDRLSALGVRVAIDDFGTGYSSLAYIKNFPIHTLKIDRSFVSDVAVNFTDQAIAKTIITLAHSLGMRTIAEGVETAAQLERLRALGADCAQGYLISIPLAPDDFATFMARRRSGKALLGSPAI